MKSIDYLKLVKTASTPRTAEHLGEADGRLHSVVWWGALANFLLSTAIGIVLAILISDFDEAVAFFPAVGPVPALIYFSFWLWTMGDIPRVSRFMIGVPSFGISVLVVYFSFAEQYEYWFTLIPVFFYFAAIAYVSLAQANQLRGGVGVGRSG